MSFFLDDPVSQTSTAPSDYKLLRELQCRVCPLSRVAENKHPHMEPTGSNRPLVYLIGEAPGKQEDRADEQFVGDSGQLLRARIPRAMRKRVRFNNVVRTRPPGNRNPTQVEIECCRPSVAADIEATRPRVIIGLGNIPLAWFSGFTGVGAWRGRRMPVRVGDHSCWYYPVVHPAFVLRRRRRELDPGAIGSEDERMFVMDLKRAFAEAESLPDPDVHDAECALRGTEIITGHDAGDLRRLEQALEWAVDLPAVGIDYETRGLRPYAADAVLLSAAFGDADRVVAFAIDHPGAGWSDGDKIKVRALWASFLRRARGVKVAHNLVFELEWTCHQFGADLARAGSWECTQVQASIIDERSRGSSPGPQSLDFLTQQYFGFSVKDVVPVQRDRLYSTPLEIVLRYNAPDARYAVLLWYEQRDRIEDDGLSEAYDLALRRVPTVVLTQLQGVPVDQDVVRGLVDKYDARIKDLSREIRSIEEVAAYERDYGGSYNPLSTRHALRIFHDMMGRSECEIVDKYTKEKKLSVDESVLGQIDHPLARLTLDLRGVTKLRSTYAEPLLEGSPILYPDGLVHTSLNTTFAETGRLSCVAGWTPIRTRRGHLPIRDVCSADYVWTHRNRWRRVLSTCIKGREQMHKLVLSNGNVLVCTKKHRVLLSSGRWVTVRELYDVFKKVGICSGEYRLSDSTLSEQRHSHDRDYTLDVSSEVEGITIQRFEDCGSFEVYDVTVEEDASYEALGIFHHNSSEPNLQNVPTRTDAGKEIRSAFRAALGDVIIAFDYGQIEARVIAMLTRDKRFCRALWERYDVHMEWAERVARAYPDRVGGRRMLRGFDLVGDTQHKDTEEVLAAKLFRKDIKNQWTFPLFFGASVASVANYLKIPESVVGPVVDEFWDEFSGVRDWQEELVEFYREHGYVECATGRRRHGPLSVNKVINSPVQGTAAEIVMDGMCRLSETSDPDLQPDLNIHDDLTWFRVPEIRVDSVAEKILDHMLDVQFDFVNVPITVEMSIGTDWMHMTEVGTFSSDEWFEK